MTKYIIGVHSGHDSSACLFKDNRLVCSIEKERLTRKKHDSGDPIQCVEYLLETEHIRRQDIDLVVRCNWYNSNELHDDYYNKFNNVIINNNHHLFHAYALSLVSQKSDMIALILDGRGCRPKDIGISKTDDQDLFESESVYKISNGFVRCLEKKFSRHIDNAYKFGSHFDSVGYAYGAVSKAIFENYDAAGKVMALAALGRANFNIPQPFAYDGENFKLRREWLNFINSMELPLDWQSRIAKDLSYSIQVELEKFISLRVDEIIHRYKIRNIGFSGGVALNCKNNGLVVNKNNVLNLNLFPASGDDGISIGAAVWALREVFNEHRFIVWNVTPGRVYRKTSFNQEKINYIAEFLLNDTDGIIGLYEGGSEYGPRALCHRSIIANPSNKIIKKKLNMTIKQREEFRPFGGVILRKNLKYITNDKIANDYMLSAVTVRRDIYYRIPALVHYDGTMRIEVVDDKNSLIYNILSEYEKRCGGIVLINTSFNAKGEPIVETEKEAIECAKKIGIKLVFLSGDIVRL